MSVLPRRRGLVASSSGMTGEPRGSVSILPHRRHSVAMQSPGRDLFLIPSHRRLTLSVCGTSAALRLALHDSTHLKSVPSIRKEVTLPAGISGSVTALSEDAIVIHEASIVAPSIHPLIYIQPIYIHRLSHPRRREFIFSSSKIPLLGRAALSINCLAVPAAWWSCISKKWSQR
jgi:hypothetical protein